MSVHILHLRITRRISTQFGIVRVHYILSKNNVVSS